MRHLRQGVQTTGPSQRPQVCSLERKAFQVSRVWQGLLSIAHLNGPQINASTSKFFLLIFRLIEFYFKNFCVIPKHCNATCTNCGKGYVHKTENTTIRNKNGTLKQSNTKANQSLSNHYCYNCCKLYRKNKLLNESTAANMDHKIKHMGLISMPSSNETTEPDMNDVNSWKICFGQIFVIAIDIFFFFNIYINN